MPKQNRSDKVNFNMLKTLLWYIFFWIYLVFAMPLSMVLPLLHLLNRKGLYDPYVKLITKGWARHILAVAGARIKIDGLENIPLTNRRICLISNHQGGFDIPILIAAIPFTFGFVAKKELAFIPLLNLWMKGINCITINRSRPRDAVDVISRGAENIRNEYPMVIFPEGTRSQGSSMKQFKGGSIKLALRAEATIIPITIDGSYLLKEANNGLITPAKVRVIIHKPVETAGLTREDAAELPEILHDIIESPLRIT